MVSFDTPCEYFTAGKAKASTLSLSVLVAIEMLNALNALSEVQCSVACGPAGARPGLLLLPYQDAQCLTALLDGRVVHCQHFLTVQDNSLLTMPPWRNPWLLVAEAASFLSHFAILYIPFLVCSCATALSLFMHAVVAALVPPA